MFNLIFVLNNIIIKIYIIKYISNIITKLLRSYFKRTSTTTTI